MPAGGTDPARPDVSVVLVHYRAGHLAARAVEAVHADLAAGGLAGEVLIVDNGSDEAERALLAGLPARLLEPGENLGFAGGVNLGVGASRGAAVVLMNPDVTVLPGCLPALLGALAAGAGIAGPRFYWDGGQRLLLPPAEARGFGDELAAALAAGGGRWAKHARRRWRRHARRHWLAEAPLTSHALSGALLAVTRGAWDVVGPFDPAYRLYFEETDWLARAARAGVGSRYVPAAGAVHAYGQSARRQPQAAAWFDESARRFRRRHLGALPTAVLERLAAWHARRASSVSGAAGRAPRLLPGGGVDLAAWLGEGAGWVEVSPLAAGFPAAAERLAAPPVAGWSLPAELRDRRPQRLGVVVTSDRGRELGRFALDDEGRPDGLPGT